MSQVPRFVHGLADWVVGPSLQERAGDIWRKVLGKKNPAIRALQDRYAGADRCFVIGNGPSLKTMDLTPLANEVTIGANSFYKHPHAAAVRLKFLCVFDPHFMRDEPRSVDWHRTIGDQLPEASFILHHSASSLVKKHELYAGREIYFVRSGVRTHRAELVDFDFYRPRNVGMTTGSSIAIPLAVFLGFKNIYLIGFDCNWLENTGSSYHFYDRHDQFPEFDSVAKDNRGLTYETFLGIIHREFESHRLIREKAESMGVHIHNATNGGLLDVYPRVTYSDVAFAR